MRELFFIDLIQIDKQFEKEFEEALNAIPKDRKDELYVEKLERTRTWVIWTIIGGGFGGAVSFQKGLFHFHAYATLCTIDFILLVLCIASFKKLKAVLIGLILIQLRHNYILITLPNYDDAVNVHGVRP